MKVIELYLEDYPIVRDLNKLLQLNWCISHQDDKIIELKYINDDEEETKIVYKTIDAAREQIVSIYTKKRNKLEMESKRSLEQLKTINLD